MVVLNHLKMACGLLVFGVWGFVAMVQAGWPVANMQQNSYQTQQTVQNPSVGYGAMNGGNMGYGNQPNVPNGNGINQGYSQSNNNNNQGYAVPNMQPTKTGYPPANVMSTPTGYGNTANMGYGNGGMAFNINGYNSNSNGVDSDENNGKFRGNNNNQGNNKFGSKNNGRSTFPISYPVSINDINSDSDESEENGVQIQGYGRSNNGKPMQIGSNNNKFGFRQNSNDNNGGNNKQNTNNFAGNNGQNPYGNSQQSFKGNGYIMPTNQGFYQNNNNMNNNGVNGNKNNPFGIVEPRGYGSNNDDDDSSEEDSRENNNSNGGNKMFMAAGGSKLQIPFIHNYPTTNTGFTGYYDSHFIENGNGNNNNNNNNGGNSNSNKSNGRRSNSNESNGRRSDNSNSNDDSRDNSRDSRDDSRGDDLSNEGHNPTMLYYYKSSSCYQCAYTPPKKFQGKKVQKIKRGGYDDSESEEDYGNAQVSGTSVTIKTRGGWDKCLGPFNNDQAKKFGIDVWDCHGNCYVRRDVNGDVFRGCYKGEYDVDPNLLGCQFQAGAVYCFCEGDKCNNGPPPPPAPSSHD